MTSSVTVRVQGSDWEELWVESSSLQSNVPGTHGVRTNAYPFGSDSFAIGVPVWDGNTRLNVSGRKPGGQVVTKAVTVTRPASSSADGVRLSASPEVVYGTSTVVQLAPTYSGITTPQQVWLDADGDGQIDADVNAAGPIPWTYSTEGYFAPRVVVRLASGVLYDSSGQGAPVTVSAAPTLVSAPGEFQLPAAARDVAEDRLHREVLVLTQDSRLHVYNEVGSLVASHTLQQVQDLAGFDVDLNGDVYAVDRGLNQLRKFLRSNAYQPDPVFGANGVVGTLGAGNAQFNLPRDIQCLPSVDGVHLWVADSGNQRLQRLGGTGAFQLQLSTGPDITQPITMVADFAGHITVLDGTDGDLAVFEFDGTRVAYRAQVVGVGPNASARASVDVDYGVLLADPVGQKLVCLTRDGAERMRVDTSPAAPLAVTHTSARRVLAAVSGAARLERLQIPEPLGESPAEVITRFFSAVHQNSDAVGLQLLASETAPELLSLLADPVKGPAYRDLAGRLGSLTELSRSDVSASVHGFVDPNTPQAQPFVIELRRDPTSNRWLALGL